jgi:hypothetical protein
MLALMATADQVKARRTLITVAAVTLGAVVTFSFPNLPGGTSHGELVVTAVVALLLVPFILRQRRREAEKRRVEMKSWPPPSRRTPKTYR